MSEMDVIEIWCEAQIELMQGTLEKMRLSRRRKMMIKYEIMGIEKVLMRIRKMKMSRS